MHLRLLSIKERSTKTNKNTFFSVINLSVVSLSKLPKSARDILSSVAHLALQTILRLMCVLIFLCFGVGLIIKCLGVEILCILLLMYVFIFLCFGVDFIV